MASQSNSSRSAVSSDESRPSNKGKVLPQYADTALVTPKERLNNAFVADNPGAWMLHCHIIEHQETGMMGYVLVA